MSVNFELFKNLVGNDSFVVTFTKKTTNETVTRTYKVDTTCEQIYEGRKNYLTVYDLDKKDYRTLVLDNIIELKTKNKLLKYEQLLNLEAYLINSVFDKAGNSKSFSVDKSISGKISKALSNWNKKSMYGSSI